MTFDALGSKTTALEAIRSLRRRGRHVQAGLLYDENASPPVPLELAIAWELEIVGSRGMSASAYPAMLTLLPHGLQGLVLASLMAAFMSTLSTHLNWGSSYVVNDVYNRFVRPAASQREQVFVSRCPRC